jgi:hypothetical protein
MCTSLGRGLYRSNFLSRTLCKHFASVSPDRSGHFAPTPRAPMLADHHLRTWCPPNNPRGRSSGSGESWFEPRRGNSKRDAAIRSVRASSFFGPCKRFTSVHALAHPEISPHYVLLTFLSRSFTGVLTTSRMPSVVATGGSGAMSARPAAGGRDHDAFDGLCFVRGVTVPLKGAEGRETVGAAYVSRGSSRR